MSLQATSLGVCLASVLDLRGPEFLLLYLSLLACAVAGALLLRYALRGPGGEPGRDAARQPGLHPIEVAYLAGGPKSAIDAAAAAVVHRGVLGVTSNSYLEPKGTPPHDLHPLEWAVVDAARKPGGAAVSGVRREAQGAAAGVALRLQSLQLSPAPERALLVRLVPTFLLLALLLLGVAKVYVGSQRNRPVGLLVFLCFVTVVAAVVFVSLPTHRTRRGTALLRRMKESNAALRTTAMRASGATALAPADLALAFALFGPAVLAFGPADDLRRALSPPSSGGSGCGSSSGCGGGDGGGGGGCGGCGGGGGD